METNTQKNPYFNVPFLPLENQNQDSRHGAHFFRNVKQLSVGFGSKVFRVDRDGMWAGAEDFASAPWSVDWEGNMTASSVTLSGYIAVGGALSDIGSGNITSTYIANGAIVTDKLAANAVTASKIDVDELSAISADVGTLTAGEIEGVVISSEASGTRTVISGTLQLFYNSSGTEIAATFANSSTYLIDGSQSTSSIALDAGSSGLVIFRVGGTSIAYVDDFGIVPASDASYNLGHSSFRWRDGYFSRDVSIDDDLFVEDNIFINDGSLEITDGFVNLAQMSGSTADARSDDQDGSMYYRTDDDVIRVKLNGSWVTVSTS